jgi:hypothetical protein
MTGELSCVSFIILTVFHLSRFKACGLLAEAFEARAMDRAG